MKTFRIKPDGPFALAAAATFGFGPDTGRPKPIAGEMRLAFVADDMRHHAAVHVTQDDDGSVVGSIESDAEPEVIQRQVSRILSLDQPGHDWLDVGQRDKVVGRLQANHLGLRPVLFHSPYEAAAWSILAAHRHRTQAAGLRTRLATEFGRTFIVGGEKVHAFPLPERLAIVDRVPGIDPTRLDRLHAVARAALEGALRPEHLLALDHPGALDHLRQLPGIGPTYATLILLRATGATDVMTFDEPRLPGYVAHFYDLDHPEATRQELQIISEGWRPFRTWVAVLVRVAGDRLNLPIAHRGGRS